MSTVPAILLALATATAASAQLATPRLGCFRDEAGAVRTVFGVAGNFLVSEPSGSGITAAACSAHLRLAKSEDALESGSERREVPGPALFSFSEDGTDAIVYLAANGVWLRVDRSGAVHPMTGPAPGGEVLAIAGPQDPTAVVRRGEMLWLVTRDAEAELPDIAPPVYLAPDRTLIFADGAGLAVRAADGAERRLALGAAPLQLETLGAGWLRVVSEDGSHFALRLGAGREDLYRLPEVSR